MIKHKKSTKKEDKSTENKDKNIAYFVDFFNNLEISKLF